MSPNHLYYQYDLLMHLICMVKRDYRYRFAPIHTGVFFFTVVFYLHSQIFRFATDTRAVLAFSEKPGFCGSFLFTFLSQSQEWVGKEQEIWRKDLYSSFLGLGSTSGFGSQNCIKSCSEVFSKNRVCETAQLVLQNKGSIYTDHCSTTPNVNKALTITYRIQILRITLERNKFSTNYHITAQILME